MKNKDNGSMWFALMIAVVWITAAVTTCVTGESDDPFGTALLFSVMAGIGYFLLKE